MTRGGVAWLTVCTTPEVDPGRLSDAGKDALIQLQTPQGVHDRTELPPVRPDVTRVYLFGGRRACCGVRSGFKIQ